MAICFVVGPIDPATNRGLLGVIADISSTAMRGDTSDRVVAALRQLSDRQRACLVLRHYEDRSESEIAEILDISIGSVRTHVHRGMENLTRLLHTDADLEVLR